MAYIFITKGKTNWKYLLIVFILGIIVGAGTLWLSAKLKFPPPEFPEIKKPEKVEVTEGLANKIIDKIVLDTKKYDRERAKFFIDDLNNDKIPEIIVCLATPASLSWGEAGEIEAYMTVVIPTDKNGDYKTIGDFVFNKERGTPFLGRPCVDDIKNLIDVDGDGKKEMIVNLGLVGVSGSAYTIFKIDWDSHKINRMKVRNKEGTIEDYYFVDAATLMHRAGFHLEDVDNDKTMEIVEVRDSRVESENEANLVEEGDNYWIREYVVYKWDGSILNYNKELSDLLLKTMNLKTYRNEEYGYEVKYPSSWRMASSLEAHWCGSPWWGCGVKEAGFENVVFTNLSPEEEKKYLDEINTYEGIGTGECHIENADGRSIRIVGVTCSVEEILQKKEVGWDIVKLGEEETKTGLKITRVRETVSWEQYRDYEVAYIPYPNKDRKIKYIALAIERNDGNYEIEIFNQMLSTFRFLE